MSQSLECPRCRQRGESDAEDGWRGRICPECGVPMVLAASPAESLVRRYLHGSRLLPLRVKRPAAR